MRNHSLVLPLAIVIAAGFYAVSRSAPAVAEGLAAPWTEGFNNKVRLVAGRASASDQDPAYAGIDIAMPAGWKTYWRAPGEAGGVPPEFDWSGSENLSEALVLYPAPHRLIDKAGATIGYKDHVLFPVLLTAKDPSQPIALKLKAAYGVCKELCVPAEVELTISVPPKSGVSSEIAAALPAVPHSAPVSGSDPALSAWRIDMRNNKPVLVLEVADPGGTGGDAFVDEKSGIYLPLPKKISETAGKTIYEVDLTDGVDIKDIKGKPVTVTLTGAKGQSEMAIALP